jgi:hypothetical protein
MKFGGQWQDVLHNAESVELDTNLNSFKFIPFGILPLTPSFFPKFHSGLVQSPSGFLIAQIR